MLVLLAEIHTCMYLLASHIRNQIPLRLLSPGFNDYAHNS